MDNVRNHYAEPGSHNEIILSTKVRIFRNIADVPFPSRLGPTALQKVNMAVWMALGNNPDLLLRPVQMDSLSAYEAVALAERQLISPDFAATRENRILLLSEDESIAVMVNEQDHLRMQVKLGGLCPEKTYEVANALDDVFDSALTYAFDEKLGFLTHNPADLGTGMHASVVLHLPALTAQGFMMQFASSASKLGLSVRGLYGEGGTAKGDLYIMTNTVTMGLSEQAMLKNLKSFALQLETRERAAAEQYVRDIAVQDRIRRAHGLLTNAMLLSCDEMMQALSMVRLGAVYGLLEIPLENINELFVTMQPANVNCLAGCALDKNERDALRAKMVKEKLC